MVSDEDLRVDYFPESTRSSGATPIGCTSGAPNEVQGPAIRNADLQGTSVRQSSSFQVIKAEENSKKLFLPNCPESISCHKQRPQAGPRIFGPIISKSTQRSGACGGQISPRVHWKDKRPHERPKSPINREVTPSWAWGGMTSEADRHKAGSMQARKARRY